jgi:hypothetical protein
MKQLLMLSSIALFLLVMADWGRQATAGVAIDSQIDHYKCYKVTGGALDHVPTPNLEDEFESDIDTVGKPVMICNPASKNGADLVFPEAHQVCYQIKGQKELASGLALSVDNQFGAGQILTTGGKEKLLCVPSLKECIDNNGQPVACPNE